jgi:hypothetical protein
MRRKQTARAKRNQAGSPEASEFGTSADEANSALRSPAPSAFLFALLWVLTSWALAGAVRWGLPARGAPAPLSPAPGRPDEPPAVKTCRPGPWGDLTCRRIMLEIPEHFETAFEADEPKEVRWLFKNQSRDVVASRLAAAGLTDMQIAALLRPDRVEEDKVGTTLKPEDELVLALSPEVRERLYAVLGEIPENGYYYQPARLRADRFRDWTGRSNLSPQTIELVSRLCYRRRNVLFFSDIDLVFNRIPSLAEKIRFGKMLSRKNALLVTLRVGPGQDVRELIAYWNGVRADGTAASLIGALARSEAGGEIDITHFLGPEVRERLYTFPYPDLDATSRPLNCYWTAANFAAEDAADLFVDRDDLRRMLDAEYEEVDAPGRLGDILLFYREDGVFFHSCVQVADDIVYTKNGKYYGAPWTLESLDDVKAFYAEQLSGIRTYRRKAH